MTTTKVKSTTGIAKRAAKKVATKKVVSTVKKTTSKKSVSKMALVIASDQHSFWVQNGEILNSLPALHAAFANMDKSVYAYHVTKEGNHFADWVQAVLHDDACATDLRKALTAKRAQTVVATYLKRYQF